MKRTHAITMLALSLLSVPAYAKLAKNDEILEIAHYEYDTYMGVNYKYNLYEPRGDWQRLIAKTHPGFDVYFGWRFHPNFGLELGYDWTANKPVSTAVANNTSLLGIRNTAGESITVTQKIRFKTGHADLNAFIPVPIQDGIKPEIILSVGASSIKPSMRVAFNETPNNISNYTNQFKNTSGKSKTVFRAGIGVQSLMIEDVGIRVLWRYENIAKVRFRNSDIARNPNTQKILFDGHSLSAGLFMKF